MNRLQIVLCGRYSTGGSRQRSAWRITKLRPTGDAAILGPGHPCDHRK